MYLLVIQFTIKKFHIGFMQVLILQSLNLNIIKSLKQYTLHYNMRNCIKPFWNILIVNFFTNSCIWNTRVTWEGIDYKLPEDDTIVSKHVVVW